MPYGIDFMHISNKQIEQAQTNEQITHFVVTGGSGLLGRHIVKRLSSVSTAKEVIAVVSQERIGFAKDLFDGLDNITVLSKDYLFNNLSLENACVIHTAFTRNNTDGYEISKSLQYCYSLFRKCKSENVKAVINFSSRSVYKEPAPGKLNDESSELNLCGLISVAKYASELLLLSTFENTMIKHTSLRIASVNELKTDNNMIRPLNVFVDCVMNNKPIKVYNGNQIMSFIDPRDVASAVMLLCGTDKEWKTLYNIGPNQDCTCKLIEMAEKVVDIGVRLGYPRVEIDIVPKDIVQTAGLDTERFKKDFGFVPQYSLDSMIESLFAMKGHAND